MLLPLELVALLGVEDPDAAVALRGDCSGVCAARGLAGGRSSEEAARTCNGGVGVGRPAAARGVEVPLCCFICGGCGDGDAAVPADADADAGNVSAAGDAADVRLDRRPLEARAERGGGGEAVAAPASLLILSPSLSSTADSACPVAAPLCQPSRGVGMAIRWAAAAEREEQWSADQ